MSGEYSYDDGVQTKLEKLSEVERSTVEDSNTNVVVDNKVEHLPTPEKVNLIVSIIDDDEGPPGPGHDHNKFVSDTEADKKENDVGNQSQIVNKEVEFGGGPSNKKQKLMMKNPSSSSSATLDLNESPIQVLVQDKNSSLTTVGSSRPDDDIIIGSSTLSASANDDENINQFNRGPSMDILEPCSSSSISSPTPFTTTNSNDNSQYDVRVVDGEIVFDVKTQEELNKKIDSLAKLSDTSSVKTIAIQSDPEDNLYIGYKQFKALSTMSFPQLKALYIGLNFHESITAKLFEDFLVKFGENLVHFHVTGGYIGLKKEKLVIRLPPLPKLEHFAFQSIYNFDTNYEVIEPAKVQIVQDDGVDLLVLDDDDDDNDNEIPQKEAEMPTSNELFRITIFLPKLKNLKEINLGNYINVITSDPLKSTVKQNFKFSFEHFKALEIFKVGSPWNKVVHFLPAKYYKVILKEIQFPDLLKDPTVLSKIAEIFPKLESVRLNLPSPFVLQQFIQIFSTLHIKELYLKTSFLFNETDGKILCGLYEDKEGEEERKIAWFGSHGNLDDFEKSEKNQKGKNKKKKKTPKLLGLGSFKKLENFEFQHIPRKMYFTKFNTTIGFGNYSEVEGFPGRDYVSNFIQELRMMKNFKRFLIPMHPDLENYLSIRMGREIVDVHPIGIYPKLLKVNKINDGKKVKSESEVKKENNTS